MFGSFSNCGEKGDDFSFDAHGNVVARVSGGIVSGCSSGTYRCTSFIYGSASMEIENGRVVKMDGLQQLTPELEAEAQARIDVEDQQVVEQKVTASAPTLDIQHGSFTLSRDCVLTAADNVPIRYNSSNGRVETPTSSVLQVNGVKYLVTPSSTNASSSTEGKETFFKSIKFVAAETGQEQLPTFGEVHVHGNKSELEVWCEDCLRNAVDASACGVVRIHAPQPRLERLSASGAGKMLISSEVTIGSETARVPLSICVSSVAKVTCNGCVKTPHCNIDASSCGKVKVMQAETVYASASSCAAVTVTAKRCDKREASMGTVKFRKISSS